MSDDALIGINPNIGSQYIDESTDISDISETDLDFSDETTEQEDSLVIDDSYEGSLVAERQLKEAQTKGPEQRTVDTSLDIYPKESPIDELLDKFGMADSKDETLAMITDDYKSEQDQEIKKELLQEVERYLQFLKDKEEKLQTKAEKLQTKAEKLQTKEEKLQIKEEKLQAKSEATEELMATSLELQSEQTKGTDQAKELSKSTKLAQESNRTEETQELSNKALDESIKFHKKASQRLVEIEKELKDPNTSPEKKLGLLKEMLGIAKDFQTAKEKLGDDFKKLEASLDKNELKLLKNAQKSFETRINTVVSALNDHVNRTEEELEKLLNNPNVDQEKVQAALDKLRALKEKLGNLEGKTPEEIFAILGEEENEGLRNFFMSVIDDVSFDENGNGRIENPGQFGQQVNNLLFDKETNNIIIDHASDDYLNETYGTNDRDELREIFDRLDSDQAKYTRDRLSQELELTKSRIEDERDPRFKEQQEAEKINKETVAKKLKLQGYSDKEIDLFFQTGKFTAPLSVIMELFNISKEQIISGSFPGLSFIIDEAKAQVTIELKAASDNNMGEEILISDSAEQIEHKVSKNASKTYQNATTDIDNAWLEASNLRDQGIKANEISNRYGFNGFSSMTSWRANS